LGVFDHAPIPNERDRPTPEALRDLIDLREEGPKVLGIAGEDLDGQGLSLAIAEQADDDLAFPAFAVAVIAEGPERIILAFKITAGDIVEEQSRGRGRRARFKEFLFNLCLVNQSRLA
jgi:hypothetical protein